MTEIPSLAVTAGGRTGAELLVVGCLQGEADGWAHLPPLVRGAVLGVAARPGWKGGEDQIGQTEVECEARQVVSVYGLGSAAELTFARLARWLARVSEDARVAGVRRLAVALPTHAETVGAAAALRVMRAAALCGYRFERFRSEPENGRLETVEVIPPEAAVADYRQELATAATLAASVAYARDLTNAPGNEADPGWIEERARELAESRGLDFHVLDAAELARRGMGGLLAVGSGSRHPPRMLRLSLPGGGAQRGGRPHRAVALVGKGITFDSGGISIKPAADMEEMKFDKAGACAVLGALRAAADLGLGVELRAYLPLAENMPSGDSFRPGDIVRCYNGKAVEITNTDAEGRMILADALAWAAEEGADTVVELSTLTGACVVALGRLAAGLFTPDDAFAGELASAGAASGERLWRLPLLPEYLEEMKALHADLRNYASRWGGACTAAAFLSQFVGGVRRWAHLDIAGVAYARSEDGRGASATGFGVAAVVDWLRARQGE